jgi:pre-mRNA-processing factor 40
LYTGDGKLYYHNSVTNISSWEKPADFVEQPLPFTQGFVPQLQIPPAIPGLGNFNAIPSSGASEKPSVYVPPVPGLSDSASLGDSSKNLDDAEELKKKNANVTVIESDPLLSAPLTSAGEFKTAEEARSAFFELFRSVKLKSSMTWQEALPMIINDKRYKALKTLNERKKAFEEYLALLKDEEEKQKAETEKKLISDYIALLDERLSALSFDVDFEASEKILNDDTRCSEFVDKKLKRRVFYDFIDAKKEIEKSKKKLERQKIVDDFKNVLSKVCGDDFNHSWKSVRQKLQDDEAFVRISESLSDSEQQRIFTDLVEDFQTKEASDRHRKRKENRKHNESFKSFLNEVLKRSEIPLHTLMTWTEFLPYIQNDTQYSEFKSLNLIDL